MLRMPRLLRLEKCVYFLRVLLIIRLPISYKIWEKRLNNLLISSSRGRIQRKPWRMGAYAGVNYNLTFYVHSRVDSNTFTMGNPVPESTLTLWQSRLYPLARDIGFGLRSDCIGTFSLFFFFLTKILFGKFRIRPKVPGRHYLFRSRLSVTERALCFDK